MKRSLTRIAVAIALAALLPGTGYHLHAQQSTDAEETETENDSQTSEATTESEEQQSRQSDPGQTEQPADQPSTGSNEQQPASQSKPQTSTDGQGAREQSSDPSAAEPRRGAESARDQGQTSDPSSTTVPPPDAQGQDVDRPRQTGDDASVPFDRRNGDQLRDRSDSLDSARDRTDGSFRGRENGQNRRGDRRQDINIGIQFGVAGGRGLTINTIERNSVFFDSGLRQGDVIISVYGRPIRSEVDFVTYVRSRPGARIPVIVLRDGREETIYIAYEQQVVQPEDSIDYQDRQGSNAPAFLGVMFETQAPNAAVIRSVLSDSPAAQAGLRAGDEIVALNGEAVSSYAQAVEMIGMMRAGEPLGIAFTRPVENQTEALLAARPTGSVRTANRPIDDGTGAVPPLGASGPPREVQPAPAYRPAPANRGGIQQNRPRSLLSPLRN